MSDRELEQLRKRHDAALQSRKDQWDPHWRNVDEMFSTRQSRFLSGDVSRKYTHNQKIVRNFATICARRFQAGLMAGITSPARPWFRFTTKDPELMKSHVVRDWLHDVEDIIRTTIARAGLYRVFSKVYGAIGFGTAVMYMDEHDKDVVRGYELPLGTYVLGVGSSLDVDTLYHSTHYNSRQMLGKFGDPKLPMNKQPVSQSVRNAYDNSDYQTEFECIHAVEPNDGFDSNRAGLEGKRWLSHWYEANATVKQGFLATKGYNEFPVMAPRWQTVAEDAYGVGPYMDALSDVRELQHHAKKKMQGIDKGIEPPMQLPASMNGKPVSLLPNAKNYTDGAAAEIKPIITVPPAFIQIVGAEMQEVKSTIAAATYSDLFMLFSETDRRQITAEEIRARQDEKMLQIGPAFNQLDEEFLRPTIDRVFYALMRRGMLPPPPEEMADVPIDVEYMNLMAQAQRLLQSAGEREFVGFAGNLITVVGPGTPEAQEVLDKINLDNVIESHAQIGSVPPDFLRTPEQVAERRAARAAQQKQIAEQQELLTQAKAAKDLSGASLDNNNALTSVLGGPVPGVEGQ